MTSILRKLLPVSTSVRDDHSDDYDPEYSFAVEYNGPPVTYEIPRAVPLDIDQIPVATMATPASLLNNLSLPIIHPIVKSEPLNKKLPKEFKLGSKVTLSPNSETLSGNLVVPGEVLLSDVNGMSCYSVNFVRSSFELGSPGGDDMHSPDGILDGTTGSSSTLGFSDSNDNSRELSESSEVDGLHNNGKEAWDLNESRLSSVTISSGSEICSCKEENCIEDVPPNVNRRPVVKFRDLESSDIIPNETDHDEPEIVQERRVVRANVKKGLCYRCKKGNRFTEKEVCIVCGAKYCGNCVLREMGSMPEGRKCTTCIGFRIDESRRGSLGKCSRMLKRMLDDSQVKQIMSVEVLCETNRLPPELVYVNGKPLCHEELTLLQGCQNPPKLKPGKYWYDKVSGFWGKEGEKPSQIISSQLAVGDPIKKDASNGNTNIMINNREITKAELRMLQFAKFHCEGSPHFWVSPDGSYQEEGMNNVMGRLWDKSGIKLVCAVLSLPIPPESANPCGEEVDCLVPHLQEQKTLNKLLLVGFDKSGTNTIFKQAKIVYEVPFSEDERERIKLIIQSNLYGYLAILLEARERFEAEWISEVTKKYIDQPGPSDISHQIDERNIYAISPKLKTFSDWLLQIMLSGNLEVIFSAASREYAPFVEEIWKDKSFQAAYSRRNEIDVLPRVANYFLDRAVEISRPDYEPSETDILYAEGMTASNGIASMEFSFPNSTPGDFLELADKNDPSLRYQLIRVHASSLGKNCKWLEMFEEVDLVVFCVSLTDYDQFYDDPDGISTNKMLVSKKLFESCVSNPVFHQKNFLLLLNKMDLLEEKIERVPLTRCEWFDDFNPVITANHSSSNNTNAQLAHRAFHYIAVKFKRLFYSITGRKLFVSRVTGLDPDSVDEALRYAREILKWGEETVSFNGDLWSSGSIEESSS